jgi:class I fructose-bisphosphate aldolase
MSGNFCFTISALNKGSRKFGKFDPKMYSELSSEHPIDLCRYQVLNSFAGRVGLINSGGESGKNDLKEAVYAAIVNKRAGGMGLIMGRKAFQKPFDEGVAILNAVQDVYLCKEVTVV